MLFFLSFTLFFYLLLRYSPQLKQTGEMAFTVYQSFRALTDPTGQEGHFRTVWKMAGMLVSVLRNAYQMHFHDVNINPEKLNHKFLKIPFRYKDHPYFYLLRIPRGVIPIQSIVDENGQDVTAEIEPYLGPNLDCGGSGVTPGDFGYGKLVVTTVLDRRAEFEINDPITLK